MMININEKGIFTICSHLLPHNILIMKGMQMGADETDENKTFLSYD
jgi:hypothetical protein